MGPLEITGTARLLLGLVTGILFGFILQKSQVTQYQKIVSFFRWSDLTVQKVMFAAILTGMIGVYALHDWGLVKLHIKPLLVGANLIGGLLFGVGMLLLGFCPGTCAAAVGEGRLDGLFRGIFGILVGAALYSEVHPLIQNNFLKLGHYGKPTVPTLLGVDPWMVIVPLAVVILGALLWMERIDRGKPAAVKGRGHDPAPAASQARPTGLAHDGGR